MITSDKELNRIKEGCEKCGSMSPLRRTIDNEFLCKNCKDILK